MEEVISIDSFPGRLKQAIGRLFPGEERWIRRFADLTKQYDKQGTGLTEGTIRSYLRGDTEPSRPSFTLLCEATGVNFEWLATGRGTMEAPEIPAMEVLPVSPGAPRRVTGMYFDPVWLRHLGVGPGACGLYQVTTDHMESTLQLFDLVLVGRCDFSRDGVYLVEVAGQRSFRRLQLLGEAVRLISDNPRYDPIDVPREELKVVGRVVDVWRSRAT